MELPRCLRLCHGIIRQREMVEADRDIAMLDKPRGRSLTLRPAFGKAGERLFRDELLMRLHPGHMRITEKRDASGSKLGCLVHGPKKRIDRLIWQPVAEIHIR